MNSITVLKFDTSHGAEEALAIASALNKDGLLKLHAAATASWPTGKKTPETKQLGDSPLSGALSGSFWGVLFGAVFAVPMLGLAVGSAVGALRSSLSDSGIDDEFIEWVREQVTEGKSALFLVTSDAVEDAVIDRIKGIKADIVATNLSKQKRQKLIEAFGQN